LTHPESRFRFLWQPQVFEVGCDRASEVPGQEGEQMATEDKQRQFDQIVERLTADYPSLRRIPRQWPRPVLITVLCAGGVGWGLLSVAMVAWGAAGIALTCAVVAITGAVLVADARRPRPPGRADSPPRD
jgi:hypothetical protein